ncbi:ABC transporter ATP-binding protein [Hahella sp. NBU794]|uniref:ABC transporter ATP-binding protein n=1 Tax=Hahella sp. NBU794 TaxID=3422590 RepID=UPI003D6FC56C
MAELRLRNVNKVFQQTHVLHDVNLQIADGEFVVFVGPSGCGKSTLLRTIAGLEDITSGELYIGGALVNDVAPAKRGVGMVFQSYALYPHMTVYENMAFGLKLDGAGPDEIRSKVEAVAQTLQLGALLKRKPAALSGGQRQRVAIGRAIVREPKVFLFDEPLSNLDASLRVQTRLEIAKLHERLGSTMIYVTHDQVEAMTLADKIVVMNQGRIEQVGTPLELYNQPASEFVATFIGSPRMNMLKGKAAEDLGAATLGIRPEHLQVRIQGEAGDWKGVLRMAEHLGSDTYVYVDVAGVGEMTARIVGEMELEPGCELYLHAPSQHLHLFDAQGKPLDASLRRSA